MILPRDEWEWWLDIGTPAPVFKDMLWPFDPDLMRFWAVSRQVVSPAVNDSDLVKCRGLRHVNIPSGHQSTPKHIIICPFLRGGSHIRFVPGAPVFCPFPFHTRCPGGPGQDGDVSDIGPR